MITCPSEIMARLRAPFHPDDLEWRINTVTKGAQGIKCRVFCYVTSRAIQERFDAVCGGNWMLKTRIENVNLGGRTEMACIASIGVKFDGEWVWREDGSDASDMEPVKGCLSGAVKRAAVLWGLGRDLYALGDGYATVVTADPRDPAYYDAYNVKLKYSDEKITFWWLPPRLPGWYMEKLEACKSGAQTAQPPAKPEPRPTPAPALVLEPATIGKIIEAFMPLGLVREDLEKHVSCPCEQWTTVHRALLGDHLKSLKAKAGAK